jgi:hypothetical protein
LHGYDLLLFLKIFKSYNKVRQITNFSQPKKELRKKIITFEGYRTPNFAYRGKKTVLSGKKRPLLKKKANLFIILELVELIELMVDERAGE